MRVAFLVQDLQLSGGVGVAVEHASQLTRHHEIDCSIVLTREPDRPAWGYRGLRSVPVLSLQEAQAQRFDLAIATWWETCLDLFSIDAARHVYFLQLLEDSTYAPGDPERMSAAFTMALPLRIVTEARWIADTVERLQPGTRALYVRNGIAKDVFVSPPSIAPSVDQRLRVVVEGNPQVPHKGVAAALEAVRFMREPHHLTLVCPEPDAVRGFTGVDAVRSGLSHADMAALFAQSDVLVKLSRVEGMYGPPLEAFHMGATVVTTPVTGYDEYIRHGENGLVVGWDDPHGTARALDLLARDRRLLHRLRSAALRTGATWPSWEQSSTFMAAALRTIAREPPPDPRAAGRRLTSDLASEMAELQRRDQIIELRDGHLEQIFDQKAWHYAIKTRRQLDRARRVARTPQRVARKLRGR